MNLLPIPATRPAPAASPQSALVDLQAQIHRETRDAERPVRRVMTWLLDRRNLAAAFDRARQADGAATPGIDGVTCTDVAPQATAWLARLADDLFHRRYRPALPRW